MEEKQSLLREDLNEIVDYIAFNLKNPTAANDLIDAIEKAIDSRLANPKSFEPFQSAKKREHQYYKIRVRSFYFLCCH